MKALVAALLLIPFTGCTGEPDPSNDLLEPGSQAVIVEHLIDGETVSPTLTPADSQMDITPEPGVRVTVGQDSGYLDRTRKDIDKNLEYATSQLKPDDPYIAKLRKEVPQKYSPPHERARGRKVKVVVETGKYKGTEGSVMRTFLRPVR